MDLKKIAATWKAYRAGEPLGDVVLLKLDAMSAPPEGMNEKLRALRGYAPKHDLVKLRGLPDGTLGREYARFLDRNGIEPIAFSAALIERFYENPFVLRYSTSHDIHHVLIGCDAGIAGEAGVFAFTVAQGTAPGGMRMLHWVRVVYPLVTPSQARRVWNNIRVGLELGRQAKLLIALPLESHFEEPLQEVRELLALPRDPAKAGMQPSGKSLVGGLIYRKRPPGVEAA